MKNKREYLSPILYLFTIICFLLPFVEISFLGIAGASQSGLELVYGNETMDNELKLLIMVPVLAVCGITVWLWNPAKSKVMQVVISLAGIAVLIISSMMLNDPDTWQQFQWLPGYYLSILLLLAIVIFNTSLAIKRTKKSAGTSLDPTIKKNDLKPAPVSVVSPTMNACPHCGKPNETGSKFCGWCGANMTEQTQDGNLCPSCNTVNEPDSNWCYNCGSQLAHRTAAEAERSDQSSPHDASGTNADLAYSPTVPLSPEMIANAVIEKVAFLRLFREGIWKLIPVTSPDFTISSDLTHSGHNVNPARPYIGIVEEHGSYHLTAYPTEGTVTMNDQIVEAAKKHHLQPGDIIRLENLEFIFDVA